MSYIFDFLAPQGQKFKTPQEYNSVKREREEEAKRALDAITQIAQARRTQPAPTPAPTPMPTSTPAPTPTSTPTPMRGTPSPLPTVPSTPLRQQIDGMLQRLNSKSTAGDIDPYGDPRLQGRAGLSQTQQPLPTVPTFSPPAPPRHQDPAGIISRADSPPAQEPMNAALYAPGYIASGIENIGYAAQEGLLRMARAPVRAAQASRSAFGEQGAADEAITGALDKAGGWLDQQIERAGDPTARGFFSPSITAEKERRRQAAYEQGTAQGIITDLANTGADLGILMVQMKLLGAAGGKQGLKAVEPLKQIGGRIAQMAGHAAVTTPGGLDDRAKAAITRIGYNITPYIANATGATGLTAVGVDFMLNTMLTSPVYVEALTSAESTEEALSVILPQIILDVGMAWSTRGLPEHQARAALSKRITEISRETGIPKAQVEQMFKDTQEAAKLAEAQESERPLQQVSDRAMEIARGIQSPIPQGTRTTDKDVIARRLAEGYTASERPDGNFEMLEPLGRRDFDRPVTTTDRETINRRVSEGWVGSENADGSFTLLPPGYRLPTEPLTRPQQAERAEQVAEPQRTEVAATEAVREPWEMTREEYRAQFPTESAADLSENMGRQREQIVGAIIAGEKVPDNVLKDFPDIDSFVQLRREQAAEREASARTKEQIQQRETERQERLKAQEAKEAQERKAENDREIAERATKRQSFTDNELWKIPLSEYVGNKRGPDKGLLSYDHEQAVQKAVSEGKPVPDAVLKDYPGLQKTEPRPSLPKMEDNYSKPLSTYSPTLYRETSIEGVLAFVDRNKVVDTKTTPVHLSNVPHMALGQGDNRGVLVEFEAGGLKGQVNTSKPTWEPLYEKGEAEFVARHNDQKAYLDAVKSVTIKPDAQGVKVNTRRLRNALSGWEATKNPDGSTTYTKPETPVTDAQKPVEATKPPAPSVDTSQVQKPATSEPVASEPYDRMVAYRKKMRADNITADEIKEQFKYLAENKEAAIDSVVKKLNTLDEHKRKRANTKLKIATEFVEDEMQRLATYTKGGVFSYQMGQDPDKVAAEMVERMTQADVERYQAGQAEKSAAIKKAIENPETYQELLTKKNSSIGLTPEETARFEDMLAEMQKKSAKTTTVSKVDTDFTVTQSKHTKTGADIWIAKLNERVGSDEFKEISAKLKPLGGYYSRYSKGFIFDKDPSATLDALKTGKVEVKQEPTETKTKKTADKLRTVADNMQKNIDDKRADRLTNTAKRATEAAHAAAEADKMERVQTIMRNIAEGIEKGDVTHLDGISARTHVETLESIVSRSKWDADRQANIPYEKSKDRPATINDVATVEYPKPSMHRNWLSQLIESTKGVPGVGTSRTQLDRLLKSSTGEHRVDLGKLSADAIKLMNLGKKAGRISDGDYKQMNYSFEDLKRLQAMGIENTTQLRAALREYFTFREGTGKTEAQTRADEIRAMERELIGRKIPGFFPTPDELAAKMIEKADIKEGMKVLEPSAGQGNIADIVRALQPKADMSVIEINSTLRGILENKQHNLIGRDFLEHKGEYDRIIMNPPFEKGQDIDHVRHAYDLLKPGGKVVAIMSEGPFFRSDKKASAFRDWLEDKGTSEKNPDNSFKESNTGVNTRTVVIEKPEGYTEADIARTEKYLRSVDKEVNEGYSNTYQRVKERGGIAPSRTGAMASEYKESVPLGLKNNNGLVIDEMADELGMTAAQLLRELGDHKPAVKKDYRAEAIEFLERGVQEKQATQTARAAGFKDTDEAHLALDAVDKPFKAWQESNRGTIAEIREQKKLYDSLVDKVKSLSADKMQELRMNLQMFADSERDKLRRQMFAQSNKLGLNREQRMEIAKAIAANPDLESTKDLSVAQLRQVNKFLQQRGSEITQAKSEAQEKTKKAKKLVRMAQDSTKQVDTLFAESPELGYTPAKESDFYRVLGREGTDDVIGTFSNVNGQRVFIPKQVSPENMSPADRRKAEGGFVLTDTVLNWMRPKHAWLPKPLTNEVVSSKKTSDRNRDTFLTKADEIFKPVGDKYDPHKLMDALEGGKVDGIEARMAKQIRETILDPLHRRLVAAGRLKEGQYIKNYMTHLFDLSDSDWGKLRNDMLNLSKRAKLSDSELLEVARGITGKDELANINRLSGHEIRSISDFIEQNMGKPPESFVSGQTRWFAKSRTDGRDDYRRDVEELLRTYIGASSKAIYIDPVIDKWADTVNKMPEAKRKRVKEFFDIAQGRPGWEEKMWNELIDEGMKRAFGKEYQGRHLQQASQTIVSFTVQRFLAAPGSALKNMTQKTLPIAELAKNTNPESTKTVNPLRGFALMAQARYRLSTSKEWQEINRQYNVLLDQRTYHEGLDTMKQYETWVSKALQTTSKPLMYLFTKADKANVSETFLATLQGGLNDGLSLAKAIEYANDATLRTQYPYDIRKAPIGHGPAGRLATLFTSWPANYLELAVEWGDWRALYSAALLSGSAALLAKMGFSVAVGAWDTMQGHLLSKVLKGEDGAVTSSLKDMKNAARRMMNGETSTWTDVFVEAAKNGPGGALIGRVDRFVDAANDDWQVRDRQGRIMYQYQVGDNPWEKRLYETTGIPGEALRALFASPTEGGQRRDMSGNYRSLIRRAVDPKWHEGIFDVDLGKQYRALNEQSKKLGLDPQEEAKKAKTAVTNVYRDQLWKATADRNWKRVDSTIEVLIKLGLKEADIVRSANTRDYVSDRQRDQAVYRYRQVVRGGE